MGRRARKHQLSRVCNSVDTVDRLAKNGDPRILAPSTQTPILPINMKTKRTILTRTITPMLALALVIANLPSADAAYWARNRNRRGSASDDGSTSSSGQKSRGRDLDGDGIPNSIDPDIDNDGIPNALDPNVDGGIARSGPYRGRYIGDRLPNNHPAEHDIDDDGLLDDSAAEHDIDGDGIPNALDDDIDGDGIPNATDTDDDGDGILDTDDSKPHGDDGGVPGGAGQVGNGIAPVAVAGFAYGLTDSSGLPDYTLNFMSATTGDESFGPDVTQFTYTYTPFGSTASMRLQYKVDKWDEYDLNYATGTFVRREFDKNKLKDTDVGSFSIAGSNPGAPGVTPVNGGTAPVALSGVNWVVKQPDGEVEANVIFSSGTAGTENEPDGDIDPFTYSYTTNGTTAVLRLDFKPGKWDEYDLDFVTGGYTRREFKNNALDDTDSGTFAVPTP